MMNFIHGVEKVCVEQNAVCFWNSGLIIQTSSLGSYVHSEATIRYMFCVNHSVLALAGLAGLMRPAVGQLLYRAAPTTEWDARIQSVRARNGVFLSPDDEVLVSSSNLGVVNAFFAINGTELWSYIPSATNNDFLSCKSGIAFASGDALRYLVHSILVNDLSLNPMTRVIAVSMFGDELWVSEDLEGIVSGTPVVSEDGNNVFLTHNSDDGTVGHFTILDGLSGGTFHTEKNNDAPFAPPGIHYAPREGYYDGGENNRNDVIVWSVQPKPDDETVGPGATFAFQFPIVFPGNAGDVGYTQLGTDVRDFQAIQKPVFTNEGRSMYWGTSRSQFRCWIGEEGLNRYRYSRPRTANIGFSRGSPAMQAVFAPLALSNRNTSLFLFGGTAANEFVRLNFDFSNEVLIGTVGLVKTEAHVSPDDAYVYYVEFNGNLHQASTEDLMDSWVLDIRVPVEGEFALSKDGTILYIADVTGHVQALRVADIPTEAPSDAPTDLPTTAPSGSPTAMPSDAPSSRASYHPTPSLVATPEPINVESIDEIDSEDETDAASSRERQAAIISFIFLVPALMM